MSATADKTVPLTAAADHLRQLVEAGWSHDQIARAANCSRRFIYKILRGEAQRTAPYLNGRLLAADPARHYRTHDGLLPSIGTVRRGRALAAIGHSPQSIGKAIDAHPVVVTRILNRPRPSIWAERAIAMTALYEQWSRTPGQSKRTATTAAQRGWHAPQAWEGSDIDDPAATPHAVTRLSATELNAERSDEVQLLASAGNTPEQIAERLGITPGGVRRILRRDYPTLYLALTA